MVICVCRNITEEDLERDPEIFQKLWSVKNCGSCDCYCNIGEEEIEADKES